MGPNELALLDRIGGAGFLFPNQFALQMVWLVILAIIATGMIIFESNCNDDDRNRFRPLNIILIIFLIVTNFIATVRLMNRLDQIAAYHRIIIDEDARNTMIRAIEKDVSEKNEREKIVLEKNE